MWEGAGHRRSGITRASVVGPKIYAAAASLLKLSVERPNINVLEPMSNPAPAPSNNRIPKYTKNPIGGMKRTPENPRDGGK